MNKKTITLLGVGLLLAVGAPVAAQHGGDADDRRETRRAHMFERADADADGAVTFDEFASRPLGHFAEADTNGDGALEDAEREAAQRLREERMEERRAARGLEGEPARRRGPRGGGERLLRADTNGDGVVTDAELVAQLETRFAELDADGDGVVTEDEALSFRPERGRR